MSCCCNTPCSCGSLTETTCADPGMDAVGKHLVILDSQWCQKRLQNQTGFLYYGQNGLRFSDSPRVPLAELSVEEGDTFGSIVINSGSNGIFRRVVPAAGVDGFLKADGAGNLVFADPSQDSIPDPLTVTTINVTDLNVENINSTGTPTFNDLQTDTITQVIGLNASDQLVKGTQQTVSVASFYETAPLTSLARPNYKYPSTSTGPVIIGNEISDPDSIASVQDQFTVKIDKAGDYTIEWRGSFSGWSPDGNNSAGPSFMPGVWLTINSVIVDKGNIEGFQDRNISTPVYGKYQANGLNVGDKIQLVGNGDIRPANTGGRGTGLQAVGIILTKFK